MNSVDESEVQTILATINRWPTPRRIQLARQILEGTGDPIREPPMRSDSKALIGLLKTDRQPPSDDDCRQIIEEERLKKYG